MKKMGKRLVFLMLILTVLVSTTLCAGAVKLNEFLDYPGDGFWGNEALQAALDNGLLYGKGDGIIDSNANLTRAEMAAIIVRAFGATKSSDISMYSDIGSDKWYYTEFAKAVRMGVFIGDGTGKMRPDDSITREEAFTVFARAMVLEETDYSSLAKFNDASNISEWAKPYLAPLVRRGYINGDNLGNINPKSNITRAEFAQFMHNMFKKYYSVKGDYSSVGKDSALIRTETVNISNITVEDDLVIGDGANESLIKITNVKIGGRLLVRGSATVLLTNVTTGEGVVVKNVNNTVHFDNYETETVFNGIRKITHATFKENFTVNIGGGTSGPSGGTDEKEYGYTIKIYKQTKELDGYALFNTVNGDKKKEGKIVSVPESMKSIYGFTLNTGMSFLEGPVSEEGLVLEVYFDRNPYTVTFDADGGEPVPADQTVYYEGFITLPAQPTKEGYTFSGWFDEDGKQYKNDAGDVLGATSLKAAWDEEEYTYSLSYKDDGNNIYNAENVKYTDEFVFPGVGGYTKEGYTFLGWSLVADATEPTYVAGDIFTQPLGKNDGDTINFYGVWARSYTVIFMDNGSEVKTEVVIEGKALNDAKMPTDDEASYSETGFVKDTGISDIYDTPFEHVINFEWWYNKGTDAEPEWELFIPEIKDDQDNVIQAGTEITKDTVVYLATQEFALRAYLNKFERQFPFAQYYANDTRFLDTVKDIIYKRGPLNAVKTAGLDEEVLQKLRDFNVIDDDNNILMQSFLLKYSMVIDDMAKFVRDSAEDLFKTSSKLNSSLPEFIRLELNGSHIEKTKLDEMLLALMDYVGMDTVKQELEESGITLPSTVTKQDLLDVVYANSSNQDMLEDISEHFTEYLNSHNEYRKYVVDQIIDKQYGDTFATLVYQLENDETFDATADTSFILDGFLNKLQSFDYDSIKAKLPEKLEKIFLIYPEEKVIEIYGGAFDRVKQEAEDALYKLENGIETEVSCATGVDFIVNAVDDIYIPLYENLTTLIEDRAGSKYYYAENIYLQKMIELFEVSNLFDESISSETGYKLKTVDEYYDLIVKLSILGDDALVWYYDNLDRDQINELADNYQELVLKYVNIVVDAVQAYIDDGELPDQIDNDKLRQLETKILELIDSKFPGTLDKLINWYENSELNKEYTDEDYDKIQNAVIKAINNINITTNDIFDEILAKRFADKEIGKDIYRQNVKNNWIQVERKIFK